jgi:TatD DNase family protein
VLQAQKHEKPLIIHSRDAEEDTRTVLLAHLDKNWKVHVHSYSDSLEQAKWYTSEFPNAFFGLTGSICFEDYGTFSEVFSHKYQTN